MGLFSGLGSLLGIGGNQGSYYQGGTVQSKAGTQLDHNLQVGNDRALNEVLAKYAGGQTDLAGLLAQASSVPQDFQPSMNAAVYNPLTGSKMASDQVRADPLTSGLLGKDGSLDRALGEEKDLQSRGWSLQPEDYEAYGQASGNIARMFGQQEQSLAQSLADRGLASGNSGIAQQQFSGLMGNKNEQLGQMQMQIAQQRMQTNMQRLNDTRGYLQGLGNLGQTAVQNQYNRNLAGVNAYNDQLNQMAGRDIQKYQAEQSVAQASAKNQQERETKNLGDALASGLYSGAQARMTNIASGANEEKAMKGLTGGQAGGGTAGRNIA